jgi:hypothetical protein
MSVFEGNVLQNSGISGFEGHLQLEAPGLFGVSPVGRPNA